MKKTITILTVSAAIISTTSCKKKEEKPNLGGTFTASEITMGNGKIHSWTKLDDEGNPTSIGFTLNDAALTGLKSDTAHTPGNEVEYELALPSQASKTPFTHIVVDWNPAGHEPVPIYGAPHFDFHFYTMSSEDRKKIPPFEVDSTGFKKYPAADYLPANYINPGGGVPEMGAHWLDMNTPELHGSPFTETFIYGTYNGQVNFIEPMITYSYLKTITDLTKSIPRPAKVAKSGYYPTKYHIIHINGSYTISFEGMEWRTAS